MATFAGQPFKFQNVQPEDVFPSTGFWNAMSQFEKFLQVFVENQTTNQRLPKQLVVDRVISNNTVNDWVSYSAPPLLMALVCVSQSPGSNSTSHRYREMLKACIEAATNDVQQKPYGDVVKYVKKASDIIHQAVNDKAQRFPFFNEYFVEAKVVKRAFLQHPSSLRETGTGHDLIYRNLHCPPSMTLCSSMRRSSRTVENHCLRRTMRCEKTIGLSSSESTVDAFLDRSVCKIWMKEAW